MVMKQQNGKRGGRRVEAAIERLQRRLDAVLNAVSEYFSMHFGNEEEAGKVVRLIDEATATCNQLRHMYKRGWASRDVYENAGRIRNFLSALRHLLEMSKRSVLQQLANTYSLEIEALSAVLRDACEEREEQIEIELELEDVDELEW